MSDTSEVIKNLIMCDVADDYEEFEHIIESVSQWASERGIPVDRRMVLDKLGELIGAGYVGAYLYLPAQQAFAKSLEYSEALIAELWFYITPKGLQRLWSCWP